MSETCERSVTTDGWHFRKCGRPGNPCKRHAAGERRRAETNAKHQARRDKVLADRAAAERREKAVRELVEAAENANLLYLEWRASRLPDFKKRFASKDDWYTATGQATKAFFAAFDRLRAALAAVRESE